MHREFRQLLKKATGHSEFVIAINLDIRGFSSFSKAVDSPEAALFLKKIYTKLIEDYFPDASFFKPAGDGLLIIIPYDEENLAKIIAKTIGTCGLLLAEFGSLCANEPMINFGT